MARYSKDRSLRSLSTGPALAATYAGENSNTTPANPGNTTGPGDEFVYIPNVNPGYSFPVNIAWDVTVAGGTLTTLVVNLEVSDDGVNWSTLDTQNGITGGRKVVPNTLVKFIRANIATRTVATGTPIITTGITI